MYKSKLITIAATILFLAGLTYSQDESSIKVEIPKLDVSKLTWGTHTVPVKISNSSEYVKYVKVVTRVTCDGTFLSPERFISHNEVVYSEDSVKFDAKILIPGNYGEFTVEFKIYSVIDTLDELFENQIIEKQSLTFRVDAPEEIASLIRKGISIPPFVGRHIDFDNDLSRVLPFLLAHGNSIEEIAKKTGTTVAFINEEINYAVSRGYYKRQGGIILSGITEIEEEEAQEEAELAIPAAEKIATKLAENYKSYHSVLDSLVKAGILDPDSNSFLDGATVLYRPYPVLMALSMWYDLGKSFITGDAPLTLYDGTDLCNAYIPQYMYMVSGHSSNTAKEYFAIFRSPNSYQINYGDTVPEIYCPEGFMFDDYYGGTVTWGYKQPYFPESFVLDTNLVRPMLDHLRRGIDPILKEVYEKLAEVAAKHGKEAVTFAHRYWFWNLVATRANELMIARGVVKRRGNGQFRFDGMNFR